MKQNESEKKEKTTGSQSSENSRILEALLFASDEVLSVAKIKSILDGQPDARKIRKMVDDINSKLQRERHPFEITEVAGGFQFRTIAYYHPWVRQLFKERSVKKLSLQALECLAIIAYKQPITKAEIEAIRGVVSDGAMKTLLERRLVTISGRSEKPGRPLLYATSAEFLQYFGINKIGDLPKIEEFEALAKEKMEELSEEEALMLEELDESDDNQQNQSEAGSEEESTGDNMQEPAQEAHAGREPVYGGKTESPEESSPGNDSQNEEKSPESGEEEAVSPIPDADQIWKESEETRSDAEEGDEEYGEDQEPVASLGGFDADDEYEEYQEEDSAAEPHPFLDEDTSDQKPQTTVPADEQPDALTDDDLPSDMLGLTDENQSDEEQSDSK